MDSQKLLEYFQNRQSAIVEKIAEFAEIESPSFDVEGSRSAVDFIENEAGGISNDFQIERIFAEGCGEHFLLRAFPSDEKPVLLLGHTDTVHPRGAKEKNPTRVEDGRLFGCGAFDMKAGCVLMLEALRALREFDLKPKRPITMLLSCDEEVGSFTGRELVEREARVAQFCLIAEPSANGKAKTGRKGTGMFQLKTSGIPAHAGLEPEKGASAVLEIAKQIEKLHALNDLKKGTTVNVCTITGGTTSNVIPAEAECSIDVRFKTLAEAGRIEREIKSLEPFDHRVSLEISGAINRPPMERTAKIAALYEKAREIAQSIGYELGETEVGGASDGNFVGALGVPVLDGLGVKGDGAHTLHEHIFIDDVPKRAALLALLLLAG